MYELYIYTSVVNSSLVNGSLRVGVSFIRKCVVLSSISANLWVSTGASTCYSVTCFMTIFVTQSTSLVLHFTA